MLILFDDASILCAHSIYIVWGAAVAAGCMCVGG